MDASTIEQWLEKIGKNRHWLAQQCNVSINTVKGWLSAGRPITGAAEALIQRLMDDERRLDPELTLEEWELIEERARLEGYKSAREWINAVLKREASKPVAPTVKSGAPPTHAQGAGSFKNITDMPPQHRAAEDPPDYGSGNQRNAQ